MSSMNSRAVGSILHGAYGDYYEQAVCLKHCRLTHPDIRLKLFAASPHRLEAFRVLDFSWADCLELWTEIPRHRIDNFFQFQVVDEELQRDVLSHLPPHVLSKIDREENCLPWHYLRSILPLAPDQQLGLSDIGRSALPIVMGDNGISPDVFQNLTIGFLWRYRSPGGAVRPTLQVDAMQLAAKYSRLFRRLVDAHGCHVLICGMKVARTPDNMYRIEAKYPDYGLDLPPSSSTHLKGLSWPLELEILSRCTLCVANPSGFSEALWIKRNEGVVLLDPPLHYLAKALWHRVPFFNLRQPRSIVSAMASKWEDAAFATISAELARSSRESKRRAAPNMLKVVS